MRARRKPRLLTFAPARGGAIDLAGLVFERARPRARRQLGAGAAVAVTAYAAMGTWAALTPPRVHAVVVRAPELSVELMAPSPPPELPRPPTFKPRLSPPRTARADAPARAAPAPAPAQAAQVIAPEAAPDEPVDLTAFSIATGDAARFAGGQTSSAGTSARAVTGAVAGGKADGTGAADLSRGVSISDTEWNDCAWPAEADALGIDEQVVSMRAVAAADGRFESADILDDPGHGFGAALLACARRHGFVPALDRGGQPVRARSGTIRFTFTR